MPKETRKIKKMKPILYVKVTAMDNMNVYLYGGPNRDEATISVVKDNMMATVD